MITNRNADNEDFMTVETNFSDADIISHPALECIHS